MTLQSFNLPETPHKRRQKAQPFKMKAYMYDNLPVSLPTSRSRRCAALLLTRASQLQRATSVCLTIPAVR